MLLPVIIVILLVALAIKIYTGIHECYLRNKRTKRFNDELNSESSATHSDNHNVTSPLNEKPVQIDIPVYSSTRVTSEDLSKLKESMSRSLKRTQEANNPSRNAKRMIGTEGSRHKCITYENNDGTIYSVGRTKTDGAIERYKAEGYWGVKNTYDHIVYEEESDDYLNDPYSYQR
jgi:hypothetical protein